MAYELIHLLAEENNGAVEIENQQTQPLMVAVCGPIKVWWGQLNSQEYKSYSLWRDAVRVALVHAGHLVYSPHRAWQGPWHEKAQVVNDHAIREADAVVILTPAGVLADGTAAEQRVAENNDIPVFAAPPGNDEDLALLLLRIRETVKAHPVVP